MPESKHSLSVEGFPYFCCSPALLHRLPLSPDITHRALIDQLQNQPPFSNILNEGQFGKEPIIRLSPLWVSKHSVLTYYQIDRLLSLLQK